MVGRVVLTAEFPLTIDASRAMTYQQLAQMIDEAFVVSSGRHL